MTRAQDTGERDMKSSRLENPSAWIKLTRYETVRLLVDALLEAPPGHQFNKSELKRRTGLSLEAIREHLPLLVELGVVNEVNTKHWAEYELNDSGKVTRELLELNSALNSVLSGESKNVKKEPHAPALDQLRKEKISEGMDEEKIFQWNVGDIDNARRSQQSDRLVQNPRKELINAD